jgi:predicted RNase H-like nuclease (RuvC/YqgF family)
MARQLEESVSPSERTDELPVLSADTLRRLDPAGPRIKPEADDSLDRSLEALREALENAERRWRQMELRLEEQDRAIRELQHELRQANLNLALLSESRAGPVPELTEIVK